ncbi:MAG: radical protein [Oscillospiraceae bacterium]|nr:radical protein [Oscillospiraceae bacterium]
MICNCCPRLCGAERSETEGKGFCRMPASFVVARAALHQWEEPSISGTNGSGTIFFSGCCLSCVFCQNDEISHQGIGKRISPRRLGDIIQELIAQGAHNINLVNPTHFSMMLAEHLERYPVPVVWNSGGYERPETLRALEGKVQIYLPDLKYLDSETALRYSGAADYPRYAIPAIEEMVRQTGPVVMEGGLLRRGVVIRHLILPGQTAQAKRVMDWATETFPRGTVLFSLMSQYTPLGQAGRFPELNRVLRRSEIRAAEEYMENLGLEGYVQEPSAAAGRYVPAFDLTGV